MIRAAALTLALAAPAQAATLTIEWTMTPGATQYVWQSGTSTFTLIPTEDWFVIHHDRTGYSPGLRDFAWWHVLDETGREIDRGDVANFGDCPVHGGLAAREHRAQPWLACGTGTAAMLPPEDDTPAPVPVPSAGWMMAITLSALAFAANNRIPGSGRG